MNLDKHITIARGIIELMKPLIEVVIHDLSTGTIVFIEGGISKRKIGDPSLLDMESKDWEGEIHCKTYPKLNFDGRLINSISIPIHEDNKMTALMCINCDVTLFQQMKDLASTFIQSSNNIQPSFLFKKDWQENIHKFLQQKLKENEWKLNTLTFKNKREIIRLLYINGAFNEKGAADYIATVLHIGRATIFNYLRNYKKD